MLKISGDIITLTRGDSMQVQLELKKGDETFTPASGDVIKFSVSKVPKDKPGYSLIISKTINNNTLILKLESADTADLAYGSYLFDLEITYASGEVDTFAKGVFALTEEVG